MKKIKSVFKFLHPTSSLIWFKCGVFSCERALCNLKELRLREQRITELMFFTYNTTLAWKIFLSCQHLSAVHTHWNVEMFGSKNYSSMKSTPSPRRPISINFTESAWGTVHVILKFHIKFNEAQYCLSLTP